MDFLGVDSNQRNRIGGVGITIGFPKVAFRAKDPKTEYSEGFGM